ncbi:MAG: extracellular solute-binding protein [Kiritimatiellae bacterium]|nr:extracellular solute-binding protein [Kiritimatiellia bacterium]
MSNIVSFYMRYYSGLLFILIACLPYVSILWHSKQNIQTSEYNKDKEIISIISPHRREVRSEYSRGFHEWILKKYGRNVEIRWLDTGGTSKILKEIESRYATSPDSPGVDLMFGGGIAPYYTAIEKGWLARIDPPKEILDTIPLLCAGAAVYDTGHRWFGVALSGFGILYNKPLIERMHLPVPETWEDLAQPVFQSWIAASDPRASGSAHMCYEIVFQAYGFEKGWSLLTKICANVRNFSEGSAMTPLEIASGQVAAGMVVDQYAETAINNVGRDALVFVLPKGLTIVGADSIAMLRGAPSPALARLFVTYVLSREGQLLLYQSAGKGGQLHSLHRLPVRKDLYEVPDAPSTRPYDFQGGFVYDEMKGMRRWKLVMDLIGIWLIDSHDDLVKAWRKVIYYGMKPEMVNKLCAPPVTTDQVDTFAEQMNDPRKAREIIKQWALDAKSRYRELSGLSFAEIDVHQH